MAVTEINIQKRDEGATRDSTGSRTYTVVLQCLCDSPQDEGQVVLDAVCDYLGIPIGTPTYVIYQIGNGFDSLARLKKMSARCSAQGSVGEYKEWLVTLEYDSQAEQQQDNPLLRPTRISGGFQEYMKAIEKDRDGKAITNSAKRKFDPPIELPDARPHLTMTRNEVDYDMPYFASNFVNRINSSAWYFGAPGQWRCVNVGGDGPNIENDVVFFTVTYEFQFRYEGWQPQVADAGLLDINGKPIVNFNGDQVTEPAPLNSDGTQVYGPILDSDWNFITVKGFNEADFNALALP